MKCIFINNFIIFIVSKFIFLINPTWIIYKYLIIFVHHDLQKPAKRGRRDTTKLIGEETVSFAFPSNFDTSKFKNIDNLLSSLEDWKLEYRKRTTGVCDPVII
jgi:hypothetical protein